MGLSQAVVSEITFKNGRAQQDNFHQFEIVRMNAAPKRIVVHLIPSDSYDMPLGGVGEPGVPVIAPALMNAINAATGKRIRQPAVARPAIGASLMPGRRGPRQRKLPWPPRTARLLHGAGDGSSATAAQ